MLNVKVKNTIRLTDKDGIAFDLDIDAVKKVCGNGPDDNTRSVVFIMDGSKIAVKDTAFEVMQKIVNAWFGI